MKSIEAYLKDNIHRQITIAELSSAFSMSVTGLKKQFSLVFGKPVFRYMREYRCSVAAILLLNTEFSVSNIAVQVGYSSTSKFISAFSDIYGCTPTVYRKTK